MINQKERIRLVMNIDAGIENCRKEMKQCAEDIEGLKDEMNDLINMRDIITYLDETAKN